MRPEQWKLLPRWLEQPGVCSLRLSMNEPEHKKRFAEGAFEPVWQACVDMGKCRGTYAENADIIRKYAAAYLPATDIQRMMHDTATRVFKWPVA